MTSPFAQIGRQDRPSRRLGVWRLPARTAVMAIINLTPDSFSDGASVDGRDALRRRVDELIESGADLLDVGAESTRPGAATVEADEQLRRLEPLFDLLPDLPVAVSLDTRSARVAEAGLAAGVEIINDVSAGRADLRMPATVAHAGAVLIAMHSRGTPATMDAMTDYEDLVAEVVAEWRQASTAAITAGMSAADVWFDPGLGFAKTAEQNWRLVRACAEARLVDVPVVIGHSRKRFVAFGEPDPRLRDAASVALAALLAARRVDVVRMHDAAGARRAVEVAQAFLEAAA